MQRRVLNYLYNQGGLVLFAFPGNEPDYEALENFALAANAGARFIVLDMTGKRDGNTCVTIGSLFDHFLSEKSLEQIQSMEGKIVFGGYEKLSISEDGLRKFYHNLEILKKISPHVVGILPAEDPENSCKYLFEIAKLVIVEPDDMEAAAVYLEDSPSMKKTPLLWMSRLKPNKKRFPKAYKAIKQSFSNAKELKKCDWKKEPEKFAKIVTLYYKATILSKNPLDGLSKVFRKFFIPILLVTVALPFIWPTDLDISSSNLRDRMQERNRLSVAPSFEFTFDGKESMQRIARYAIGRFNAVITNEKMIKQYVEETLDDNGYNAKDWQKGNHTIPPEGTVVKFSRPDNLSRAAADSIGAAWKYWTSVVSDSVAYLTEFYHEYATANQRQHNGIDVASRQGARILAPFAARAWTSRDERGGIIIGLVREKDVVIFMHCDQLLYLDGQEVMPGDPIATVGVTGHTTGPHAHVVTGEISRNGNKRIGNVKYKVIDPMTWFYKYKPSQM